MRGLRTALICLAIVGASPYVALAKPAPHPHHPAAHSSHTPAASELQCGAFEDVLGALHDKYGESPVWGGVTGASHAVSSALMLTESKDGATWTLLALATKGGKSVACLVNSGTNSVHAGDSGESGGDGA